MKIKIFSMAMPENYSDDKERKLEKEVNDFLKDHPDSSIQWIQSGVGSMGYSVILLTAVITYK